MTLSLNRPSSINSSRASTVHARCQRSSEPAPASTIHPSDVRNLPYGAKVGECEPRNPGTDPLAKYSAATVERLANANSKSEVLTRRPCPLCSRSTCAASSPTTQLRPEPTSSTGAPTLTGPPRSSPVTLISPLSAWRIRSKPPRSASGPTFSVPRNRTVDNRWVSRVYETRSRARTRGRAPGREFSTKKSLTESSRSMISRPSGERKSTSRLRLPVFSDKKSAISSSIAWGPGDQYGSPVPVSIFTTSAPRDASTIVAYDPDTKRVRSRTRSPASGGATTGSARETRRTRRERHRPSRRASRPPSLPL